jgi:hypothetical protein
MQAPLPEDVERQIDRQTAAYREQLTEFWQWILNEDAEGRPAPTAMEIEQRLREWLQRIGEDTQGQMLGQAERYRRKGKQACPKCGGEVYWSRYESRQYISSLGELAIERAYYHHGACHCGWVPLDEQLQLGASELSPLVQEMASYLGAWMPFAQAAQYLARYQNIHISHDVVNASTVRVGEVLAERQAQAVQQAWETHTLPASEAITPPQRLYVSADGIHHLLPTGEGKEVKVAAIYETAERVTAQGEVEIHAQQIDYVVAATGEDLAKAAYLRAVQRGVEQAAEIGVLGDGANWIWNRVATMFPRRKTTEIVDFFHASEYLWDAAREVWGTDDAQIQTWCQAQCHTLKHEGAAAVRQALHALPPRKPATASMVVDAQVYFENQQARMDYPQYVANGWQIGSGSAESAVKQVVGVRMNQAGMRWNAEHAVAVAHVRATILSERWDAFWDDFQPPPRQYQHAPLAAAA